MAHFSSASSTSSRYRLLHPFFFSYRYSPLQAKQKKKKKKKKKGLRITPVKIACETFNEITLNFGKANENISIREPVVGQLFGSLDTFCLYELCEGGTLLELLKIYPPTSLQVASTIDFLLITDRAVGILANPTLPERTFKIFQITLLQ